MNKDKQEAVIEAVLFSMGSSVKISRLAELIEATPDEVRDIVAKMKKKMDASNRGVTITEIDEAFQMCSKAEMYEYLIDITKSEHKYTLTDTVLETLSIIAYKQPITRLEVEKIRGVNSDHAVNRLVEFGLVQELGRLDAPGRPLLFGTTEEFLRSFGVRSLDELPTIGTVQVEEFKQQAEQEINVKLDI